MPRLEIVLTRDEIAGQIPYSVICEVRYGSRWGTANRKRRWLSEFTEEERAASAPLFRKAEIWYIGTGIPAEVRMTAKTYDLWQKLGNFCGSL